MYAVFAIRVPARHGMDGIPLSVANAYYTTCGLVRADLYPF
jgi:hypothetical protein